MALLLPLFPILFIVSSIVCVATYGADGCRSDYRSCPELLSCSACLNCSLASSFLPRSR